jgi:hypothetical protein
VLGGEISRAEACRQLAIADHLLDAYLSEHAKDRLLSLEELRMPATMAPGMRELWSHLKRLESMLRARQRELAMLRQIARGRGLM